MSSADVTDGLDKGGSRQPEAKGNMEDIKGPGGPAERRPEPEEHKEHGAVKFCKHRPPERHGPELPHGGKCSQKKKSTLIDVDQTRSRSNKEETLFLHSTDKLKWEHLSDRNRCSHAKFSNTQNAQHAGVETSRCVTSDSVIDSSWVEQQAARWASMLGGEHGERNVKHVLQTSGLFTRAGGARRPFYNTPGARATTHSPGVGPVHNTTSQNKFI